MTNADRLASHLHEVQQALEDAVRAGAAAWAAANLLTAELIAVQAELDAARDKPEERGA